MIKIAVCDDENIIVNQLEEMILEISEKHHIPMGVDAFYSGEGLEQAIVSGIRYDLLYLDIQMEGKDGITTAQNIRKIDEDLLIICVSGYDSYMIELFRLDVFGFIRKPIQQDIFEKTLLEANQRMCSRKVYFKFQYKGEEHKLLTSDILYFESRGRQIQIYIKNGGIAVFNGKLNEVEDHLANGKIPFLRIHQSYLVNYHWIKVCTKNKVKMVNGGELQVSEERQKMFGIYYGRLLGGEIGE